ncbi:MAG: hypothetical protein ACI8QC_000738 [Planctomycetota bacterium]|jgi:hypothetical protein
MLTCRTPFVAAIAVAFLTTSAQGQGVVFSISWNGPTVGVPDTATAVPITEGDILAAAPFGVPALGPLPAPFIARTHGAGGLGLMAGCVGHPGGTPCFVEVDALSMGTDPVLTPNGVGQGGLCWSTDEFATGFPSPLMPNLFSEFPAADTSADVWTNNIPMFGAPLPPFASPPDHRGFLDGNGVASFTGFTYPGLGLIEPNPPAAGPASAGDDLDALTFNHQPGARAYFSLDSGFLDPVTGVFNTGSAGAHGFSGSDVLMSTTAGPVVFAPGPLLGLDMVGPQDDLDALYLWENGSGAFEPSLAPYDWLAGGTDLLLFSVRRGSPVIGFPDSIFGIPISEGDILTTPLATAAGGVSPFPGIFIAAENLGLATGRSGLLSFPFDDDLNALAGKQNAFMDCNGNGIEDVVDIAFGAPDANMNGIPDSCETSFYSTFCFCAAGAPCGNADPTAGCTNSTGSGGLLTPSGSTSIGSDDLVLTATSLPPLAFGIPFMGPSTTPAVVFGDGLRCVAGGLWRFPIVMADAAGTVAIGPGLVASSIALNPPAGQIALGSTWNFQHWYRDPFGPCGTGYSVTNAVSATFVP